MTDNYVPLGFTDGNVRCGCHIAYVYQSDVEKVGIAIDFIAAGIRNNEKCIAAILETSSDLWINGLRSRGINPGRLNCNQLEVINAGDIARGCRASGLMDKVYHSIVSSVESSLQDKWNGIRLCAGFDSFLHNEHIAGSHLPAEHGIDEITRNNPLTALCLFGSNTLHPLMLDICTSYHPYITYGSQVLPNSVYKESTDDNLKLFLKLKAEGAFEQPFTTLDFDCGIPVIHTGIELDLCTVPSMEDMGERLIISGHRNILVDLSETTFMDASSLSALIRMTMAVERLGGQLVIFDPSDPLRKIFRIIGLNERIPVYRTIEQARDIILSSMYIPDDSGCCDDEDLRYHNLTLDL